MKKFFVVVAVFLAVGLVAFFIYDDPLPEGRENAEAEALADEVLAALGAEAWKDVAYARWTFSGEHDYTWDKKKGLAGIKWEDHHIKMDLNTKEGTAYKNNKELKGEEAEEAIQKAWEYWCNDSFWFIAPLKIRDPGTSRSIVQLDGDMRGLLVKYTTGGATPGDAYLWKIAENGLPVAYEMWVSIIPIGGVEATWADWQTFEGVKIATMHKLGPLEIPISNIKLADTPGGIGLDDNYFQDIR
jgi:hypothetical protein